MNMEPEALVSLFDTIILPIAKPATPTKKNITPSLVDILSMYFKKENSSDETVFLSKILSAIKLTIKDVEINIVAKNDDLSGLLKSKKGTIIVWGLAMDAIEKYVPKILDESTIICVDAINEVMNAQALKSKLWICLKSIYKL